ncbi:hypothetical protein BG004_006120, partial [Podila humilis]
RRGIVTGLAASGGGIGSTTLAPLARYLLAELGFRWTVRILGGVMAVTLAVAVCFLRPYTITAATTISSSSSASSPSSSLEEKKGTTASSKENATPATSTSTTNTTSTTTTTTTTATASVGGLDFSLFRRLDFTLIVVAINITTLVFLIPLFLISNYVTTTITGATAAQGAMILSVSSAVMTVSRIIMGMVGDRLGVLNTAMFCSVLAGLNSLVLWNHSKTVMMTMWFMALYGISAGSLIVLLPVTASKMVEPARLPSAIGFTCFAHTIGFLVGTPIAQAIVHAQHGSYSGTIVYVGVSYLVVAVVLVLARLVTSKKKMLEAT